jgi:hypothetical protein
MVVNEEGKLLRIISLSSECSVPYVNPKEKQKEGKEKRNQNTTLYV